MPEPSIDLHAHTTASDGSLRPAELVRQAAADGLSALAVTDHDTAEGLEEARDEARRTGIELVNGIEISVHWEAGTFHLLGYLFEETPALRAGLQELQGLRRERNARMIAKLNELGYRLTEEEVAAEGGGGQIGRLHIARALLRRGAVSTVEEAFGRLLRRGRPAFVMVDRLGAAEAIRMIRSAGGVAVVAHPFQLRLGEDALDGAVAEWTALGLGGIEVQHSSHDAGQVAFLSALAGRHNLAATGGSDFHGENKPGIPLGRAGEGARIPLSRLEDLRAKRPRGNPEAP
ncbi:MAG: PHP domain-containing protein [Candidatus Brocadiae bacterium]|nr:PHP domain-containing protein [Candidatus Brocadiia bacterium]